MSILIKDAKMPKNCAECQLLEKEIGSTWVLENRCFLIGRFVDPYTMPQSSRPSWCPLVEIPEPHGRLIDARTIRMEMLDTKADAERIVRAIAETPTVIGAEESC